MGKPAILTPDPWLRLQGLTRARVALGRAGVSLPTTAQHLTGRPICAGPIWAAALRLPARPAWRHWPWPRRPRWWW
jgi:acyl-coenzyme A thioesterase PaaI-like protein